MKDVMKIKINGLPNWIRLLEKDDLIRDDTYVQHKSYAQHPQLWHKTTTPGDLVSEHPNFDFMIKTSEPFGIKI